MHNQRPLISTMKAYPTLIHPQHSSNKRLAQRLFHMTAAPPKRAPIATTAVARGPASVDSVSLAPPSLSSPPSPESDEVSSGVRFVAASVTVGTPEVKGTAPSVALLAPLKAGVVVEGLGVASALSGLRTLCSRCQLRYQQEQVGSDCVTYPSITWTTPLATSTSGMMTLALFTNTPSSPTVICRSLPSTVSRDVLLRPLL